MKKILFYLILLLLFCIGTTLKFANTHEPMPIGCDEFGYLNLASTLNNEPQTSKLYFHGLLEEFRKNNITEQEYAWMILPHAYHIVAGTSQSINQYQPGTSFILKWLPISIRNLLFPALLMFLLICIPVSVSIYGFKNSWNVFDMLFPVFLFLVTVSAPFTTELARVNSLAFTFGLLLAAGMIIRQKPFLACFLIALSINFRIVNALMVLPAFLFLPLRKLNTTENFITNLKLCFKGALICLAAVTPLLWYNYSLLGNPFAITYSSIDTAVTSNYDFGRNLLYYFDLNQRWLVFHIITISILIAFTIYSQLNIKELFIFLLFPGINYGFFMWHAVTMDYYPYASVMLMAGGIFGICCQVTIPENKISFVAASGIIIAIVVLVSGFTRYNKKNHLTFQQAKEVYSPLCSYDIVWSDLFSGTTEYVCQNSGFRFATSTPRARKIALDYLYSKGYWQIILIQDIPMPELEILHEIENTGLPFTKMHDTKFGTFLSIPPAKK